MQSVPFPLCNNVITRYAVNMLFRGHKANRTKYLVLKVVQQLGDKEKDANCPLLKVDWLL